METLDDILKVAEQENIKILTDDKKTKIIIQYDGYQMTTQRHDDQEINLSIIRERIEDIRTERFYNSDEYQAEFIKNLETAILATRGGGSGAVACRDTLLSLYNGYTYQANLSNWFNLDNTNRQALLYVLEHHTRNHAMCIDEYLPEYKSDFERMKNMKKEVEDNDR